MRNLTIAAFAAATIFSAAATANAARYDKERDICAAAIADEVGRAGEAADATVKKARPRRLFRITVELKFEDDARVVAECFIRDDVVEKLDVKDRA